MGPAHRFLAVAVAAALLPSMAAAQQKLCPPAGAPAETVGKLTYGSNTIVSDTAAEFVLADTAWMRYKGFAFCADRLRFDRGSGQLVLVGETMVRDPNGNVTRAERFTANDDLSKAFDAALAMSAKP